MGEQKIECGNPSCTEKATHHVIVRVWPVGADKKTKRPIKIVMHVMLCERHAQQVKVDPYNTMIIYDLFWRQVDSSVKSNSGMPIDRESMEVRVVKGSPRQHEMN